MEITVKFHLNENQVERMKKIVDMANRVDKEDDKEYREINIESLFRNMMLLGSWPAIDERIDFWESSYLKMLQKRKLGIEKGKVENDESIDL